MTTWLNASIQMQFRVIDGLSVRYAESDDRSDTALLLSPWPESLLAFEPTWPRLAERARLVAVDLPEFGHSQLRDALLSPQAMGDFIIRIADAFGLENRTSSARTSAPRLRCSPRPGIRADCAA
jgi:pimeloyl-ACP methyl ester carboxylesterase